MATCTIYRLNEVPGDLRRDLSGYIDADYQPRPDLVASTDIKRAHAELWQSQPRRSDPPWFEFLHEKFPALRLAPRSRRDEVLLLVRFTVNRRGASYAIPFGAGRNLLADGAIDADATIRIAIRSFVEASGFLSNVKGLTAREISVNVQRIEREAARLTSFFDLSFDEDRQVLQSIRGRPSNEDLGTFLSSGEGIQLRGITDVDMLIDALRVLEKLYRSTEENRFAARLGMRALKNGAKIEQLDNMFATALWNGDRSIGLALPDLVNVPDDATFEFSHLGRVADHPEATLAWDDLRIDNYRNTLHDTHLRGEITGEYLRKVKLMLRSPTEQHKYKLYNCLSGSVSDADETHVLDAGKWYRVPGSFIETINAAVDLPGQYDNFPPFDNDQDLDNRGRRSENAYVQRAIPQLPDSIVIDKQLIRTLGHDGIEFGDAVRLNGEIIEIYHFKRWSRSASLSHLFTQAITSASALSDPTFRAEAAELLQTQGANPQLLAAVGEVMQPNQLDITRLRIVLGIIMDWGNDPPSVALPILARIDFERVLRGLRSRGFQVALARIPG